jgi:beta-glucosidase
MAGSDEANADARARETEARLTDDERLSLLVSVMGTSPAVAERDARIPDDVPMSAGYVPGVPRLGLPALLMTDASLGVTNPGYREGDTATALPAGLALAASFDPTLARTVGAMLGREARSRGFNVLLGPGINLVRDPRGGRNFEYLSEDPLLTATLAAAWIDGLQAEGVIAAVKHYSLNSNETNRHRLDAIIDPAAHRESDLLAFELVLEWSHPGSVMTGYNLVNGVAAGASHELVEDVLRGAWGFPGWVMSDWGATESWEYALAGLDQESGAQIDAMKGRGEPFTAPLRDAHADGRLPSGRLSQMVRRILRSVYALGVDGPWQAPEADPSAHDLVALEAARRGIVLLENDGLLPLAPDMSARIAVIGGFAQTGVPIGTGSSAVLPAGGYAMRIPLGGPGDMGNTRNLCLLPSVPVAELRAALPDAEVEFDPGLSPAEAALLARRSDVAIVFAIKVEGEGFDSADIALPWGQDAVIEAVAAANPNTIVVLETGNPVAMQWRERVRAIVQAWYPGQAGARAIAEVIAGAVNPSGRLPVTFPAELGQTPRPELPGLGAPPGTPTAIRYDEGAEVGYRWFASRRLRPLYAFGHGLGYTTFEYDDLEIEGGETVSAAFTVRNTGLRAGADVPQFYLVAAPGGERVRLLGFERVELEPGESRRVDLAADPRLLARYDTAAGRWRIDGGSYRVALGRAADDLVLEAGATVAARSFGR